MFDKLRNKFILSNIVISSAIILTAFVMVFAITANTLPSPRVIAAAVTWLDENSTAEIRALLEERMRISNAEQLADLALVLIFVGLAVEALVFAASYYMAEKSIRPIREAYAKQKEFIANASHELKTPIAIVQANFEALGADEQPWTGNIESNLTRANNLINDLLALARADNAVKKPIQKTQTNVHNLIEKQARCFEPKLEGKTFEFKTKEQLVVNTNAADLTQIVNILIDNAVKYSEKSIEVSLNKKTKTIAITNDGKTVPKARLDKIFDRFYQLDKTSEGSGLGLAIAKGLANKNGWALSATSTKGRTTFIIGLKS
ncbi:MAG: sensor histidine kinase [Candidatus Saccharimonadales bacterium]